MFVKSLSLRNFRNFQAAKFSFVAEDVNTILGENASGKTNVFHAMRLVLDDTLPANSRYLVLNDFCREVGLVHGHWIVIQLCFGGLGASDEELVMANHIIEGQAEGIYTFVYRPKIHIRQKLFELGGTHLVAEDRLLAIKEYLKSITIGKEDYEAVAFVRTAVDFSDDGVYQQLVGNFSSGIFPNPADEDTALIGSDKPAYFSLIKEVTCTYVKALRNVVYDLKYSKSSPLLKLLDYKSSEVSEASHITTGVKKLNDDISNLRQVKRLSKNISKTLSSAVGQTYSPEINIASDLPEDIKELIKALSLVVEDSTGYKGTGNIEDLSLGGANLIYLALKLYEYEMRQEKNDKIAHFLLIEEPEAHIHNHIQKTLFSNFKFVNTQVFISTHSTQISSASKISSMNMLSRKQGSSDVFLPANGLSEAEVTGIERYLDAMRSTLLFAKSVILVEGDAEQILIPEMVKSVFGISLDEMGISLVNMDGTVFVHISNLFNEERIRNYCSILTDRDAPFLTEKTSYADDAYVNKLINANENGAIRFKELNSHCSGNEYLSAFFAENTFETELILAGNQELFISVLGDMYKQSAKIERWTEIIGKGKKSELCHVALYLANKVGKGWFAILLSKYVSHSTLIPDYILDAISHSLKGHERQSIYRKIMSYRLRITDPCLENPLSEESEDWDSCVSIFRDILPDDPLLALIDKETE